MNSKIHVAIPRINNHKTETSTRASLHWESIIILAMLLMLFGCCPLQKFNKACRYTKDSLLVRTNTVTVYRDTIVAVKVLGDTVTKVFPVYLDDSVPFSGISELETPLAKSIAWVNEGKLNHSLFQKDTIIKQNIKNALRNTSVVSENKQVSVQTKVINEPTKWQWVQIYLGRVALCLMIFGFAFSAFRFSRKN